MRTSARFISIALFRKALPWCAKRGTARTIAIIKPMMVYFMPGSFAEDGWKHKGTKTQRHEGLTLTFVPLCLCAFVFLATLQESSTLESNGTLIPRLSF